MTLRIVVADDHTVVQEGLRALLSAVDGYELVDVVGTGTDAVRAAVTHRPDVVVMDIQMPGMTGIEATREIARVAPKVAVLMLTMFEDDESVFSAMRAGARGYVLKGGEPSEIMEVLRAVAKGEAHFGPEIARRITGFFSILRTDPAEAFPELTAREREILDLIARGHGNQEIARRLFLSPRTVRNHISHIFSKLQIADRAQAIVRAREAGMGRDGA
jgi:DNA-binding NarL/FixJ family response regulator